MGFLALSFWPNVMNATFHICGELLLIFVEAAKPDLAGINVTVDNRLVQKPYAAFVLSEKLGIMLVIANSGITQRNSSCVVGLENPFSDQCTSIKKKDITVFNSQQLLHWSNAEKQRFYRALIVKTPKALTGLSSSAFVEAITCLASHMVAVNIFGSHGIYFKVKAYSSGQERRWQEMPAILANCPVTEETNIPITVLSDGDYLHGILPPAFLDARAGLVILIMENGDIYPLRLEQDEIPGYAPAALIVNYHDDAFFLFSFIVRCIRDDISIHDGLLQRLPGAQVKVDLSLMTSKPERIQVYLDEQLINGQTSLATFVLPLPMKAYDGEAHELTLWSQHSGTWQLESCLELPRADYKIHLEKINQECCEGWIYNENDPLQSIVLALRINHRYRGSYPVHLQRRDVQTRFGLPHAKLGFKIAFPPLATNDRYLTVELLIAGIEKHVYGPRYIRIEKNLNIRQQRELNLLAAKIDQIEKILKDVQAQLPGARQRIGYALEDYGMYHDMVYHDKKTMVGELQSLSYRPLISIILPINSKSLLYALEDGITRIVNQYYSSWELWIVNEGQSDQAFQTITRYHANKNAQIHWLDISGENTGNYHELLSMACGDYLLFLQANAVLSHDILLRIVELLQSSDCSFIYTDNDWIDEDGNHVNPEFKPDFSPDLLLSTNYIGSFFVSRDALTIECFVSKHESACRHELALHCCEHLSGKKVIHIENILYHVHYDSTVSYSSGDSDIEQCLVLQGYLNRYGYLATAAILNEKQINCDNKGLFLPFMSHISWSTGAPPPKVSIIIPTKDGLNIIRGCIDSIVNKTLYSNYEIIVIDHQSQNEEAKSYFNNLHSQCSNIKVIHYCGGFNWSAINNFGVNHASGEVLCFLNNDTEVISPEWLTEMVGHALRPQVGVVGAKLYYEDDTIQHGGVIWGMSGLADHAFMGLPANSGGYLYRALLTQNYLAVTGACMVCRKSVYEQVGGFDAAHFAVAFNDVDFCLKAWHLGYRNVWTPFAQLYHFESRSRGYDEKPEKLKRLQKEIDFMKKHWLPIIKKDPYYNQHFELHGESFQWLNTAIE